MKKHTIILLSLFIVLITNCKNSDNIIDIGGKWYSFYDDDYIEYDIDSVLIYRYSDLGGNLTPMEYKIENDSLKFKYHDVISKITIKSDSSFVLENEFETVTLYRLNDSITTFNEIDSNNDSIHDTFLEKYVDRRRSIWIRYGHIDENDTIWTLEDSIRYGEIPMIDSIHETDTVIFLKKL